MAERKKEPPKKKQRYTCKYQDKWTVEYPWLCKSRQGIEHAFCKVCVIDIKVDHGGKTDLKKHTRLQKSQNTTAPVTNLLTVNADTEDVIRSETLLTNFVAEHNLPFAVADHFIRLCKQMFPDSKIAKKFSCGQTKTTMIVKNAIAPALEEELVKQCKTGPFSFGSNDTNQQKTLAIVVKYFDEVRERAVTRFLDMPICNIGTAQSIVDQLDATFETKGIPWKNVVAFISDNCNTMVGKRNSVVTKIKEKSSAVFDIGCVCHLVNLCTVAGVKALPVPVEDFLVDVFDYFQHR